MKTRNAVDFLATALLMCIFSGCGAEQSADQPEEVQPSEKPQMQTFDAMVLQVNETSLLVEPGSDFPIYQSSDRILADLSSLDEKVVSEFLGSIGVNDLVRISYDGTVAESYPAQISATQALLLLDASEPLLPYTENADGTFSTEDHDYQYRIDLRGRLPHAACDSIYTVLTNKKDVTFEEVAKSLYSGNSEDFLDEAETIIINMQITLEDEES